MDKRDPKVIVVTDCGSTTTKAVLFEHDGHGWRLAAAADAATTVEAPTEDVIIGVRNALLALGVAAGRRILDAEGRILRPASERSGVDLFLSTSSAGGGLQVAVLGAVDALSARIAEKAALGAGAIVIGTLALNAIERHQDAVQALERLSPDIVLLAGGVEGGAEAQVLELVDILASSNMRPRYGDGRLPLLYAGNSEAFEKGRPVLDAKFLLARSGNVLPSLGVEDLASCREAVHDIFLEHVMSSAPGLKGLKAWVDAPVIPTPSAVSDLLEAVGKARNADLLAVDIGGATTDLFSWREGSLFRTVSANLGMSYSAIHVIEEAGLGNVLRWLAADLDPDDLRDRLWNKAARPTTIPFDAMDLLVEQALAREALRLSYRHHRYLEGGADERETRAHVRLAITDKNQGFQTPWPYRLLVGSGGVLSHAPRPGQTSLMMLDAFEPRFHVTLARDQRFMMPHLGVLGRVLPEASLSLFGTECLSLLGDAVCLAGRIRPGRPAATYRLVRSDRPAVEGSLAGGDLVRLDMAPDDKGLLVLDPAPGVDAGAGPGRRAENEVQGGEAGVLLDGRGRPLAIPRPSEPAVAGWVRSAAAMPEEMTP